MLRPLAAQQQQLLLGEGRVDVGDRDAVEGQVPGGEPGVLPVVGHGDHVGQVQVAPAAVAGRVGPAFRRRGGAGGVAVEPLPHAVAVDLLAPVQAREGPTRDVAVLVAGRGRDHGGVELVGLRASPLQGVVEVRAERVGGAVAVAQPQSDGDGLARLHGLEEVVEGHLGAVRVRAEQAVVAVHDRPVHRALGEGGGVLRGTEGRHLVGLVVAPQHPRGTLGGQRVAVQPGVLCHHLHVVALVLGLGLLHGGATLVAAPHPGVAEPQLRHQVQGRRVRAVVGGGPGDADVVGVHLGMGGDHVEEAVLVQHAGVGQLELVDVVPALPVGLAQLLVGEGRLRIAVEVLRPGVGGGGVQRPVVLLDVLAVVALRPGQRSLRRSSWVFHSATARLRKP